VLDHSSQEAEAHTPMTSGPAWSIWQDPGQLAIHNESLFQNTNQTRGREGRERRERREREGEALLKRLSSYPSFYAVSCFRPGQQPGRILSLIDKRDPFIFSVTFGVRSTHSVTQLSSCHFTGCSSHCIHGIFGFVPAMHGVPVQRVPGLTGHHGLGLSHEHRAMPDTQPRLSSPLASQTTASLHSCRLCTRIWGEIPPHCTPRPPPWGGASSAPLTHPWTRCTLCQRPLATGSGLLLLSSSPYCPCNLPAVPRCISVLNNCLKLIRFFYIFQTY
jgi:hypothetical protein